MSVETWTYIIVGITFLIYIYIGYWARVKDTQGFYVAGRGVPSIANGAATAADWMSAASFISMAGLISSLGYDGAVYLMGWTGGYVLLALLLAPYLRKFGKFTVPDFVGDRYYSQTARLVAAIAAIFISFVYVAGQVRGVGIVFSRYVGVDIATGVIIGVAVVGFFAIIGGMKGVTYTQVAQYGVLILAYLIPAVAISGLLTGNPIPQAGFTFSDLMSKLNQIHQDLGFAAYTNGSKPMIDVFSITMALMVGTAGLPHIIVRFYTVPNVKDARASAGWALLFIALLYTTAPAVATFARYNLLTTLNGKTVEEARAIPWVAKWEKTKLLQFADKNSDGKLDIAPGRAFNLKNGRPDFKSPNDKSKNEVYIDNDIIVLSTPEVAKLAPWIIALVAAGGLAAAMSTASGLLLVVSSSVAHDIYYRLLNPKASEAQRLMVGRVMILIAVVIAAYFGVNPPGFVAQVVAFAFGLAASSFFPIIMLGIFDKRMNSQGAIAGMLTGLIFTTIMILLMKSDVLFGTATPALANLLGISAEGIGTVGMVLNFVVAYVVSRATASPPETIQHLVEDLRIPRGAGAAAHD